MMMFLLLTKLFIVRKQLLATSQAKKAALGDDLSEAYKYRQRMQQVENTLLRGDTQRKKQHVCTLKNSLQNKSWESINSKISNSRTLAEMFFSVRAHPAVPTTRYFTRL